MYHLIWILHQYLASQKHFVRPGHDDKMQPNPYPFLVLVAINFYHLFLGPTAPNGAPVPVFRHPVKDTGGEILPPRVQTAPQWWAPTSCIAAAAGNLNRDPSRSACVGSHEISWTTKLKSGLNSKIAIPGVWPVIARQRRSGTKKGVAESLNSTRKELRSLRGFHSTALVSARNVVLNRFRGSGCVVFAL
jgi:hypothetical protein